MSESGKLSLRAAVKPVSPAVTRGQALDAVRTLLAWAGEDPAREGLRDTPRRTGASRSTWWCSIRPS
jgi:GTP cyclohydrolase I